MNPKHLAWETGVENQAHKRKHGTHLHGEKIHLAIITQAQAQEIYNSPLSAAKLASLYGFKDRRSIFDIRSGKTWPDVDRSKRWGYG